MDARRITIAIEDESQGYAISPSRVPLGILTTFSDQVQAFIRGSDREMNAAAVTVSVVQGSLGVQTEPLIAPRLFHDFEVLLSSGDLGQIDPKRRSVVEEWQAAAKAQSSRAFRIAAEVIGQVIINSKTDFKAVETETWVAVERYIQGELMDLGGVKSSNAHIKLPDGSRLIVRTDRDLIRAEKQNKVYQSVHVRIRAKYNVRTGELKDPTLLEFVDYSPRFDEASFVRAVESGKKAWSDVEDPVAWVRGVRGHDE